MKRDPFRITPGTALGWASVGLIIAMPVLFFIGTSLANTLYRSIPAGGTIPADIAARPASALATLAGILAGISALVTGLLAIFRRRENVLLVYLSAGIGALMVIFITGVLFSLR